MRIGHKNVKAETLDVLKSGQRQILKPLRMNAGDDCAGKPDRTQCGVIHGGIVLADEILCRFHDAAREGHPGEIRDDQAPTTHQQPASFCPRFDSIEPMPAEPMPAHSGGQNIETG